MHQSFSIRATWLLGLCASWLLLPTTAPAADEVRPIPPPGIAIPEEDRDALTLEAARLRLELDQLDVALQGRPAQLELLPDVEIFHKAVDWALRFDEFYATNQVTIARELLAQGRERAEWLRQGLAPWTKATGLVVRGYRSRIDGSVQPYGLVVPDSFGAMPTLPHRLDFWFHGRGEKLTELDFIHQRNRSRGEFAPPGAFVLHPYGRYCNANKFAGEVDLFEALEHARKFYPIDENRITVRGFSMGGAACWQFATHFAGQWAAAAPGAGFAESPEYLNVFREGQTAPPVWEQRLWRWYNATDYALNLFHCPTVAYSGEIDKQKQAADVMARALSAEGMSLTHIIGAGMGHKYDDRSKAEIDRRLDALVARGRDPLPREVRFTTFTLRYSRMHWVVLEGLEEHWERAVVTARIEGNAGVAVTTTNVTHLRLDMPAAWAPFDPTRPPWVELDGQRLEGPPVMSDRSWQARFRKVDGRWAAYEPADDIAARKRPGLQGPIDDAFMDRFLFVRPSGQPLNEKSGAWVEAELARAVAQWRGQFRGELKVKSDVDVTPEDLREHHLILFGDPSSNRLIQQIYDVLPITWMGGEIVAGGRRFAASHHQVASITPNPLSPKRYVVLNSGFTFREADYLSNAMQTPKLPDWAVIDLNEPASARAPGNVVAAGFFDERWRLPANP